MIEQGKLKSLGITHPKDLQKMLNCSMSLALKIWYRKAELSLKQAQVIKEKTGASLDYLLN